MAIKRKNDTINAIKKDVIMSSPIAFIFERHWDTTPKELIKNSLPEFHRAGVTSLCFEFPQNLTTTSIQKLLEDGVKEDSELIAYARERLQKFGQAAFKRQGISLKEDLSKTSFHDLAEFSRLCVSSKSYLQVAERIKQLPASILVKDLCKEAAKHEIDIKGVDIDADGFNQMVSTDIPKRLDAVRSNEALRLATMVQNLMKIRAEKEGAIIFVCGVMHAKGLIQAFEERGMKEQILYYMPHSEALYSDGLDDIQLITEGQGLDGRIFSLKENELTSFANKICRDIKAKTPYRDVVENNSHAEFLSQRFSIPCQALLRAKDHVDVLAPLKQASTLSSALKKAGIDFDKTLWEGETHLTVYNVNDPAIACTLRTI
jgi:hypothetical protein